MSDDAERLLPEGEYSVSPEFQALWDELGAATDEHFDAAPWDKLERHRRTLRYVEACGAILKYVHRLEANHV